MKRKYSDKEKSLLIHEIIRLRTVVKLPATEVAKILKLPLGTVTNWYFRYYSYKQPCGE